MKKIRGNYVSLKRVLVSVGLVIAALSFSAPSHASLIIDFEFTRPDGLPVAGTITGLIAGDVDAEADTVVLNGDLAPGIDFADIGPDVNRFSVDEDGIITSYFFCDFRARRYPRSC